MANPTEKKTCEQHGCEMEWIPMTLADGELDFGYWHCEQCFIEMHAPFPQDGETLDSEEDYPHYSTCYYCGAQTEGYCYLAPDGKHHFSDD